MTTEQIKQELEERLVEVRELMWHAEQDGNSDYDYLQGIVDAYEVVLVMLAEHSPTQQAE